MNRYSDTPLPATPYVPGKSPRPPDESLDAVLGAVCFPFGLATGAYDPRHRLAIDLLNAGNYWEAHEAWEHVWVACGRRGDLADFVKGMVKLAAAGVKHAQGNPGGAERHARRAAELFGQARVALGSVVAGIDLATVESFALRAAEKGWDDTVRIKLVD
jgi:hypothetical protein